METVLVIGAARSGIAVSKLLQKNGYHVILTDSNEVKEKMDLEALGIEVVDNGHPDWLLEKDYPFVVKIQEFHIEFLLLSIFKKLVYQFIRK